MEIPTYPYDEENKGLLYRLRLRSDKIFTTKLKKYLDLIVTFNRHKEIFGVPTIFITNGIDCEAIPICQQNKDSTIKLIGIGKWQGWHGLDRVIAGLITYSMNVNLKIHIIGDGPVIAGLKNKVRQNKLEKVVVFHGSQTSPHLDNFFSGTCVGIGSLGLHRLKLTEASPLKHREFCARGIPFLLSKKDFDFPRQLPWVKYLPDDDSPINFNEILQFAKTCQHIDPYSIRNYARTQLTWNARLKDIIAAVT